MSSNPFRRAVGAQAGPRSTSADVLHLDTAPERPLPPPKTSFRADEPGDEDASLPLEEATGKRRVVKKVRVLSPPPLSPDSPEWPYIAAPQANPTDGTTLSQQQDPFGAFGTDSDNTSLSTPTATPPPIGRGPPANPFSKTLQDLEGHKQTQIQEDELESQRREEGAVLKAARGSMNVDAFHRLLMTGNAGVDGHGKTPRISDAVDEAQTVDTVRDAEIAAAREKEDSDESESSSSTRPPKSKKPPPPPPSSRHGKAIKDQEAELSRKSLLGEHHKPLPPGPQSPTGEPAPLTATSPNEQQSISKKPVPAPPPRRTPGRPESKVYEPSAMSQALRGYDDEAPSRSSIESMSRSNSTRQTNKVPAPPPPRRQHVAQRSSSQQASPTSSTFKDSHLAQDGPSSPPDAAKPPRPPPSRNPSQRRPPSVSSVEAPSRNVSGETPRTLPPPPRPPPSRKRGSSKGSIDSPQRRVSLDKVPSAPADPGAGGSILADLDALRREVDALRGKVD